MCNGHGTVTGSGCRHKKADQELISSHVLGLLHIFLIFPILLLTAFLCFQSERVVSCNSFRSIAVGLLGSLAQEICLHSGPQQLACWDQSILGNFNFCSGQDIFRQRRQKQGFAQLSQRLLPLAFRQQHLPYSRTRRRRNNCCKTSPGWGVKDC